MEIYGLNHQPGKVLSSSYRSLCIRLNLLIVLLAANLPGLSQNFTCYIHTGDTLDLDTLVIDPQSVSTEPPVSFRYVEDHNQLIFSSISDPDSIRVCFRKLPEGMFRPFYNRSMAAYEQGTYLKKKPDGAANHFFIEEAKLFEFGDIHSYGSITRGITFGNRQNVFVNSSLNLQMDGRLTNDLQVSAVITDQNIPYQPEGNTQQIRDFDNVFIRLYNDRFSIIAGDVVLNNPVEESYFLRYRKNVQGIKLSYDYQFNQQWKGSSMVTGSLARGQFISTVLDPQEGVQGPYKLRGPNGERFIVVMANSEKVYVDGKLMKRGFDHDYVIDYNLGEITFTTAVVITRFSRIRVEYEYSDQYYSRSNITAAQVLKSNRTALYLNFYQEKDNPRNTLGFELNESDYQILKSVGDDVDLAGISGVDSVGYGESGIFYERRDTTTLDGSQETVYVYSQDASKAHYQLSFSEVGKGNGNYQLAATTANGKVFEWLSPINGIPQGSFKPVRKVPTPNQKSMFVVGLRQQLSGHESFFQETAISKIDKNLYSPLDDNNNLGIAWKGGFLVENRRLGRLPAYRLDAEVTYEFNHRYFQGIDRFRSIDYDRDWSYDIFSDSVKNRQDQILSAHLQLRKDAKNDINYDFQFRNREGAVNGIKHVFGLEKQINGIKIQSNNLYSENRPGGILARWLRSDSEVRFNKWSVQPGYRFSVDQNTVAQSESDSILVSQMHYTAHNFFLASGDSSKNTFRLDYIDRQDRLPVGGELTDYTDSEEFRVSSSITALKNHQLDLQLNYRKVTELIKNEDTQENILGRIGWNGSFFRRLIDNRFLFSTSNSRELRRAFIFVNVATGEGTHTWRDENQDGIQDLNEFYEAINVDERNYIKLFTPTDEYINAFQTVLSETFNARFPSTWESKGAVASFLSHISFSSNLRYNYKTTDPSLISRMNPFGLNLRDENILSSTITSRSTLFFNRNEPGFGVELSQINQDRKSLLSNGYELRSKKLWEGSVRLQFATVFTARSAIAMGDAVFESDFLESRNFNLSREEIETELIWQPESTFRLTTGLGRRARHTYESENEGESLIYELRLTSTWQRPAFGNLNVGFNWLNIGFEGEENTFLAYELLEALQPGNNQRWSLNWQQSIGKGMQLTAQYQGRKSSASEAVHTGTVQVTAFF